MTHRRSEHGARRGGEWGPLGVVKTGLIWLTLGVWATLSNAAPRPVAEAARALADVAWAATIRAEVSPPDGAVQQDTLEAGYDPAGIVRLRLGALEIEATPGRFVATHRWNTRAVYIAEHEGADIAGVLAAELPPLWCPWLAIALNGGDPGAWPIVSEAGVRRFVFDESRPEGGAHAAGVFVGRGVNTRAQVRVRLREMPDNSGLEGSLLARRLVAYAITLPRGASETTIRFTARFQELEQRSGAVIEGREPVASLAELTPPPPEIGFGDRLPTLAPSAIDGDDLAARPWRLGDVFDADLPGRRPTALVLVVVRPRAAVGDDIARAAGVVARVRLAVAGAGVIARPIVATATEDVDRDRLRVLREAWHKAYRADGSLPEVESRTPEIAWLPASQLLGRVSPGTDSALVVVDRGGWIVGVIPDMDDTEGLLEAVRRASR